MSTVEEKIEEKIDYLQSQNTDPSINKIIDFMPKGSKWRVPYFNRLYKTSYLGMQQLWKDSLYQALILLKYSKMFSITNGDIFSRAKELVVMFVRSRRITVVH